MESIDTPIRSRLIKLLPVLAILLATGVVASCGSDDKAHATLSLLEWNGYQLPEYYPDYMAKYGEEPSFTFFDNADNALKRMRTGHQVDLVHFCTGQLAEAKASGLIKPIDISRIPRWNEITPALLALPDVQIDGDYWMVPWEWGYSTVAYNPDHVETDDPSYDLFIDPRYKGKTALPSDIGVNMIIAGVIGGWKDPIDPTEEEILSAPAIFTKMLKNARFIWTDSTQLEQAWAGGDVSISYVYGSASRRMPKEGMPTVVVEPLQTWMCGLSLSANGAGSEDAAYDYLNAMLDPVSGVALFDEYGYGHGNAGSLTHIDPALTAGTGIDDPDGTFARGIYTKAPSPATKAQLFQLWFEAQAGLN